MGTPWFKFFGGDYLYDPKIMNLNGEERSCWITLLCYASVAEIPGEIKYLNEDKLLITSNSKCTGIIKKLCEMQMITQDDNGTITITNFRKRQGQALSGYERVKKWRERNAMITPDNANDNNRVEKSREEKRYSAKADFRESPKLENAKDIVKRLMQ